MVALLPSWSLRGVVAALRAMRGVALLSAITLMAEIGDFRRFASIPAGNRKPVSMPKAVITPNSGIRRRRVALRHRRPQFDLIASNLQQLAIRASEPPHEADRGGGTAGDGGLSMQIVTVGVQLA